MKKGPQTFAIVIILAACMIVGVLVAMNMRQRTTQPPPVSPGPSTPGPEAPGKAQVYGIDFEDNELLLRAVEIEVGADAYPPETAIRYLIEQGDMGELTNPIPEGARLLGVSVESNLASIDLSREFTDNFPGGSMAESLAIGAILRTLGQFPDINRVQIFIEGEPLDTLGHLDLSGPLDVEWAHSQFGDGN